MLHRLSWLSRATDLLAVTWLLIVSEPRPLSAATPLAATASPQEESTSPAGRDRATALANGAILGAIGQATLQAAEPTLASVQVKSELLKTSAQPARRRTAEVLMIGDSLSVGGFGESVEAFLARQCKGRLALFASCGSSPEHWLRADPVYVTKCGYRQHTPEGATFVRDFENHHPPTPTATPKVEDLLERYQPSTVVVQLGTNWLDALEGRSLASEQPKYVAILDRFGTALRRTTKSVRKIIWITPPDSAKFSPETERNVNELIRAAAKRYDIELINSASMTHYTPGKTGGDGVHYRNEEAYAWAAQVKRDLRKKL